MKLLLAALVPLAYAAHRAGLLRSTAARLGLSAVALALVVAAVPAGGVDFALIKRANLLIAAAVLVLLAGRWMGPARVDARAERDALMAIAALAVTAHLNFFSFHGQRTWVHYHDVAHYYLGGKYFAELGYGNLYTALLRAEAETQGNRFRAIEARDLATNEIVHIRALLVRSDPVRAAFSPARWEAFRQDAAFFREALGPQYATVLKDHGFNPTPVWLIIAGALANRVPAGSHAGILALTLLDPLLLAVLFAAVARTFGLRTALIALIHFCIVFGATFGWTGGAFLRYVWFVATGLALCALGRGRAGVAGALVALAAILRLFPAAFIAGAAFKTADGLWRGSHARAPRRAVAGFAAAAAALVLATALGPRGLAAWAGFAENMRRHLQADAPNLVGLTGVIAYREAAPTDAVEAWRAADRRGRAYRLQLVTVFPAVLALAALLSRRQDAVEAAATGVLLAFAGLNLAAYYTVMLVFLTIAFRDRPERLAVLFGLEAVSYALLLFEENEWVLYAQRSLLLAFALGLIYAGPARAAVRDVFLHRVRAA